MTLDEIEQAARNHSETPRAISGVTRSDISVLSELLIALVGHVRAVENVTRMTDDRALERITSLENTLREKRLPVDYVHPRWPTPQPIETAPLGEILTGPEVKSQEDGKSGWVRDWSGEGQTVEEWRLFLKRIGRRWWLPMPPPLPRGGA